MYNSTNDKPLTIPYITNSDDFNSFKYSNNHIQQ